MFSKVTYAAEEHVVVAQGFLEALNQAILYPLITLMMAVALLVFLYGGFEYVKNSGSDEGRTTGQRHLLWGVVGMLVMISAYAILTIAAGTFELQQDLENARGDSGFYSPTGI